MHRPVAGLRQGRRRERNIMAEIQKGVIIGCLLTPLRSTADRLLNVVCKMIETGQTFDPERRSEGAP